MERNDAITGRYYATLFENIKALRSSFSHTVSLFVATYLCSYKFHWIAHVKSLNYHFCLCLSRLLYVMMNYGDNDGHLLGASLINKRCGDIYT